MTKTRINTSEVGRSSNSSPLNQSNSLQAELHKLAKDLQKAQEEIAELKTLIAFYEENVPLQNCSN